MGNWSLGQEPYLQHINEGCQNISKSSPFSGLCFYSSRVPNKDILSLSSISSDFLHFINLNEIHNDWMVRALFKAEVPFLHSLCMLRWLTIMRKGQLERVMWGWGNKMKWNATAKKRKACCISPVLWLVIYLSLKPSTTFPPLFGDQKLRGFGLTFSLQDKNETRNSYSPSTAG